MAQLNTVVVEHGNTKARYEFAFRVNGTSNPDATLDCKSNVISSVVRSSEGLFLVTLAEGCRLKEVACGQVTVAPTAATDDPVNGYVVPSSLNVTNRTFQVQCHQASGAVDPADNSIVNVTVSGPMSETFTDE